MKSAKPFFFSALPLAFAALLLSSCEKTETPRVQYEAGFYIGGHSSENTCIYKDGEIHYRLGNGVSVKGLALTDNGTLYASGHVLEYLSEDEWKDGKLTATLWKDGKPMTIDSISDKDGFFENIVVNGDHWASCANYVAGDGQSYGCVVADGKMVYTSQSDVYFLCIDDGASGDYYVVADDKEGIKLLRISAEAPHRLLSAELIAPHEEGFTWIVSCLHVGANDIAVGLNKFYSEGNAVDAYIWINGGRGLWCMEEDSEINDLTFFFGYVVAVGHNITMTNTEDGISVRTTAVQWVNGQHQDFSAGCTGNSSVTMVRNMYDMFLFQCVQSESGLQLCDNGFPYKEVKTPADFLATCWDVVVTPAELTGE